MVRTRKVLIAALRNWLSTWDGIDGEYRQAKKSINKLIDRLQRNIPFDKKSKASLSFHIWQMRYNINYK